MGDENNRFLRLFPDTQQFLLQVFPRLGVKRGKRFIHQQHAGIVGQCPGNGHPLLHTAGQFMRIAVGEILQPHQFQIALADCLPLRRRYFLDLQTKLHVLTHSPPGEKCVALHDKAPVQRRTVYYLSVDTDFAGTGMGQPGKHI